LLSGTGDASGNYVLIPPLQTNKEIEFLVGGDKLLRYTGDTLLVISGTKLDAANFKPYHTLYAFHTTPKTWLFLTIAVAIGTALLATIGNWLVD